MLEPIFQKSNRAGIASWAGSKTSYTQAQWRRVVCFEPQKCGIGDGLEMAHIHHIHAMIVIT